MLPVTIIILGLALASAVTIAIIFFQIWMLVDAIVQPVKDKAIWILIMLAFPFIGALIYYFAVKRHFSGAELPVVPTPPTSPTPPAMAA